MQVSSYIEAFLTVYGWATYETFYTLFTVTGIFWYPLIRALIDAYTGIMSAGKYASNNYLKSIIMNLGLIVLVFILAIVPVAKINLNASGVQTVCGNKETKPSNQGKNYFDVSEAKVPIIPYLSMSIGYGINAVVYKTLPCTTDITELMNAKANVNFGSSKQAIQLRDELNQFVNQCHNKAVDTFRRIRNNEFGIKAQKIVEDALAKEIKDSGIEEAVLLRRYGSSFFTNLFYKKTSPLSQLEETKSIVPMRTSTTFDAAKLGSASKSEDSGIQQTLNESLVYCDAWWSNNTHGLRNKIVKELEEDLVAKVGNNNNFPKCRYDKNYFFNPHTGAGIKDPSNIRTWMSEARIKECLTYIKSLPQTENGDKFNDSLLDGLQKANTAVKDGVTDGDSFKLIAGGLGALIGTVASAWIGVDLTGGIAGQAISFYASMFLFKLILKFLMPMILMGVYMFWGVYCIVSEFRTIQIVRGMFMIIVITMIPSMWAIADHIDDSLFSSMYQGSRTIDFGERIILDVTSGLFYFILPMILIYAVSSAGGGNASGLVQAGDGDAKKAASQGGSVAGKTSNTVVSTTVNKDKTGTSPLGRTSRGVWGGFKGGINKVRGKK